MLLPIISGMLFIITYMCYILYHIIISCKELIRVAARAAKKSEARDQTNVGPSSRSSFFVHRPNDALSFTHVFFHRSLPANFHEVGGPRSTKQRHTRNETAT